MATTLQRPAEKARRKGSANGGELNGAAVRSGPVRRVPGRARAQEPHPVRWTREQYHKMGDWGWFRDKRVELIEGVIYEKYPPRGRAPHPVRWTREQYHKMGEKGWFEGRRVELLEGEIYEMSPMNRPHWASVMRVGEELREAFRQGYLISTQLPVAVGGGAEPEPDVAVIPGGISDYPDAIPATAILIVEISDTTLRFDRSRKAHAYAQAGIPEYWIVNLNRKQLEVHREPKAERGKYGSVTILTERQSVAPLAAPRKKIKVADLLP